VHLNVRPFVPRPRLLCNVTSRAKQNGAHAKRPSRDDVVVNSVADHDALMRLDGEVGEKLKRPAVAKGGVAIGIALIVPSDEALVARIREASESFGGEVGISAWNGFAMARFCAQDAAKLRADMVAVLGVSGSALPRLWLN